MHPPQCRAYVTAKMSYQPTVGVSLIYGHRNLHYMIRLVGLPDRIPHYINIHIIETCREHSYGHGYAPGVWRAWGLGGGKERRGARWRVTWREDIDGMQTMAMYIATD